MADLTIDVGAMRVWQDGAEQHLPPLSFELLVLLVRRAPDVVSHDECLAAIWRGVVVGPETLKQRVKLLREALSDDSRRPRYVETVRGRGYRLLPVVELQEETGDAWPSRLRSRLRGLLGAGPTGGNRGSGGAALGAILLIASLTLVPAGAGRYDLTASEPETAASPRVGLAGVAVGCTATGPGGRAADTRCDQPRTRGSSRPVAVLPPRRTAAPATGRRVGAIGRPAARHFTRPAPFFTETFP